MTASARSFSLSLLPGHCAIVRLAPDATVPAWAAQGEFFSITRTQDELSIVCPTENVPSLNRPNILWRALKAHGPFRFDEIGVLASLASPLVTAKIGIFVISTFDTDYLLVQSKDSSKAIAALRAAGHNIQESEE